MVFSSDYIKAAVATMCIDAGILYVVLTSPALPWFDNAFVLLILCSHLLFYYALLTKHEYLIQCLHYCIFISLAVSIFLKNTKLVMVCLGLLLTIQILWIVEDRCILNNHETMFGYSKELSIAVLLYTVILATKIGFNLQGLSHFVHVS
jgi:hypothetical protein